MIGLWASLIKRDWSRQTIYRLFEYADNSGLFFGNVHDSPIDERFSLNLCDSLILHPADLVIDKVVAGSEEF